MKLRFGTFLAPNMMPVYQALADEVGRQMGVETELVVETDYENCAKDLNDICFVCSLPYVEFEKRGISPSEPFAAPVLEGKRYGGKPIYFSDVIVRTDSPYQSFLHLRGHSWCYNEPHSQSGYGITRYHMAKIGETNGFFSKAIEAGFHQESIRKVAAGEIDGSAIDSQVLAVEMREHPELKKQIRVIESFGPSTIQPVAASKRLPVALRKQIQEIFLSIHQNPAIREKLAFGFINHFAPVDASSYDDIRQMYDASEAADFMKIR